MNQKNSDPKIQVLCEAQWDLLERTVIPAADFLKDRVFLDFLQTPQDRKNARSIMHKDLQGMLDFIMQQLPVDPQRAFGREHFIDIPAWVQKEWHQKWYKKFQEVMPFKSWEDFSKEVAHHRVSCKRGRNLSRSLNWEDLYPKNLEGNERVTLLPQDQTQGLVYKFSPDFHFMQVLNDDQNSFRPTRTLLMSPIDILLHTECRNAIELFHPMKLMLLEGFNWMSQEQCLPVASEEKFSQTFGSHYEPVTNFLTSNGWFLGVWDLCPQNCLQDGNQFKLMDMAFMIRKMPPEQLQEMEKLFPKKDLVSVDLSRFGEWEKHHQEYQGTRKEMEAFIDENILRKKLKFEAPPLPSNIQTQNMREKV